MILTWMGVLGSFFSGMMFIACLAFGLRVMVKQRRRQWAESRSSLRGWAVANGYTIRSQEREPLWSSPFPMSSGQVLYRIAVEDRRGQMRRGWALCGGWFLGTLSERVEVRWADAESLIAPSSPKDEPLWDEHVDA